MEKNNGLAGLFFIRGHLRDYIFHLAVFLPDNLESLVHKVVIVQRVLYRGMPQIPAQVGEHRLQFYAVQHPAVYPVHDECVPQGMYRWIFITAFSVRRPFPVPFEVDWESAMGKRLIRFLSRKKPGGARALPADVTIIIPAQAVQVIGEEHKPVLVPFGMQDFQYALPKVDVLPFEVEPFRQPEAAAVKQADMIIKYWRVEQYQKI